VVRATATSAAPGVAVKDRTAATAPQLLASGLAVIFVGGFAAAYVFSALGAYNHNDHLAAVAPAVMQQYAPYSDFAFDQTPLSLLLFYEVGRLIDDQNLYTILRIMSVAFNLGILINGIAICRTSSSWPIFVSVIFAGLYLSFPPTEEIGGEIGNYTLSLLLFSLSLLMYRGAGGTYLGILGAGVFLGLAVSSKINYSYLAPVMPLSCFLSTKPSTKRALIAAVYCIGLGIGLLPVLFYLVGDFKAFIFLNIYSHYLQNLYRGDNFVADDPRLFSLAVKSAAWPVALIAVAAGAVIYAGRRCGRLASLTRFEKDLLALFLAALLGVVTPGVILSKYWALPGFLLFLFVCIFAARQLNEAQLEPVRRRQMCFAALCIVVLLGVARSYDLIAEATQQIKDGTYGITAVARFACRGDRRDQSQPAGLSWGAGNGGGRSRGRCRGGDRADQCRRSVHDAPR
jgi:hypothetical protein